MEYFDSYFDDDQFIEKLRSNDASIGDRLDFSGIVKCICMLTF